MRIFHSGHVEFVAPISWIGNVSTAPYDITTATPGHFQNFYPITRWATGAVATLTMVDAAACIVWTWVYRDTRVVKAAQPIFLALTALGALITLAATIPLARDHRDIAPDLSQAEGTKGRYPGLDQSCAAAFWLFCLGFVSDAVGSMSRRSPACSVPGRAHLHDDALLNTDNIVHVEGRAGRRGRGGRIAIGARIDTEHDAACMLWRFARGRIWPMAPSLRRSGASRASSA